MQHLEHERHGRLRPGLPAEGLRERKRRRTRASICPAALELFDRHGFRATTLADIAHAADVSPRTVSGYFPTKEALAFPAADEEAEALAARLRRPGGRRAGDGGTARLGRRMAGPRRGAP